MGADRELAAEAKAQAAAAEALYEKSYLELEVSAEGLTRRAKEAEEQASNASRLAAAAEAKRVAEAEA